MAAENTRSNVTTGTKGTAENSGTKVKYRLTKKALEARRANAQKSTGPKTPKGKSSIAKNALKHGLSLPVAYLPPFQARTDALVEELLKDFDTERGENAVPPSILNAATAFAEAHIDLERVRAARINELQSKIGSGRLISYLAKIDRYEKRALARRHRALSALEVLTFRGRV